MNEKDKIYIVELLIEINDVFTCLSDKLNILYFKFEPLLKELDETPNPPHFTTPEREKIYADIQTSLHNIDHILYDKSFSFYDFNSFQKMRNQIDMNTENIQNNLNNVMVNHE